MPQAHVAGERAFTTYSAKGLRWANRNSGDVSEVELLVSMGGREQLHVLPKGRSALPSSSGRTLRGFAYFGGVRKASS